MHVCMYMFDHVAIVS